MNLNHWKKFINEGISDTGKHNMKYYAFDWDDNIVEMPTKIIMIDEQGQEVGMTTSDFALYRSKVGKEPFEYEGHQIKDFAKDSFRGFRLVGDKAFIKDAMTAELGPAWNDFVECINSGSIFAIITARGHNPTTMKRAVYNYIMADFNGIDQGQLRSNIKKYNKIFGKYNKDASVKGYLDMCKFYPVSFGTMAAASPEQGKVKAFREFIDYCKKLNKGAKISMGFSDDDRKNMDIIEKHFSNEDGLAKLVLKYTGK